MPAAGAVEYRLSDLPDLKNLLHLLNPHLLAAIPSKQHLFCSQAIAQQVYQDLSHTSSVRPGQEACALLLHYSRTTPKRHGNGAQSTKDRGEGQ
jgi:hypothetical protein